MSNSTTIRVNDGSEPIYSGQNAPLTIGWKKKFDLLHFFPFVHIVFNCLTGIKKKTFFFTNPPPLYYSINIKMLFQ